MIRYNRCRGRSNPHYFVWYHSKIVICRNFDILNHNADISLENLYDSTKVGMVGISESTSRTNLEIVNCVCKMKVDVKRAIFHASPIFLCLISRNFCQYNNTSHCMTKTYQTLLFACSLANFSCPLLLSSVHFFSKLNVFKTLSECQAVRQIRANIL